MERCPLCPYGHKVPGRSRCRACLDLAALRTYRRNDNFIRQHVCYRCGKNSPKRGTMCDVCRRQHNERQKERLENCRISGVCRCGWATEKGKRYCKTCKDKLYRRLNKNKERRAKEQAMRESALVSHIIQTVKKTYPHAYVRKISERFNRGMPDILIVFERGDSFTGVLWVETKAKNGRLKAIQWAEHEKIKKVSGIGCDVIVATNVKEVMDKLERMDALQERKSHA